MSGFFKNIGQEYIEYDPKALLMEEVIYKHELKGYGPEFDKTYIFKVASGHYCDDCVFYNLCINYPWDIVIRKAPDQKNALPRCHGDIRFTLPKI